MRVALIGTRGVPAQYGGFETCVEEVGSRLAEAGHGVVVFCRASAGSPTTTYAESYRGMSLVTLPTVRRRSVETLAHTAVSVFHRALGSVDAAVLFNAANAPLIPVLRARKVPVATHVDGLEWRRGKWGPVGQRYYRLAESLAVRWSDALIADAQGISDYYRQEFDVATELIAYGAPFVHVRGDRMSELGLQGGRFHLVVARFEPENHVLESVRGFTSSNAQWPLVVVGGAPYSESYVTAVKAACDSRVRLLGSVWDQELLDELYARSGSYIHGHSVGGTNPSLLRAAGAGAHVLAYDVNFNREVMRTRGAFWRTPDELARLIIQAENDPDAAVADGTALQREIGRYNWDDVAAAYGRLCQRLADQGPSRERASGRRGGR